MTAAQTFRQFHDVRPWRDYDSGEVTIPLLPNDMHSLGAISIEAFAVHMTACGDDYNARGGAFRPNDKGFPAALDELVKWGWLLPAGDGQFTLCRGMPAQVAAWIDADAQRDVRDGWDHGLAGLPKQKKGRRYGAAYSMGALQRSREAAR